MSNEIDVSPANVLHVVQKRRMEMILNGEDINKDFLMLMAQTAKTAIDEVRTVIEGDKAQTEAEIAGHLARLIARHDVNPLSVGGGTRPELEGTVIPDVPLIEGELSRELPTMDYRLFTAENKIEE